MTVKLKFSIFHHWVRMTGKTRNDFFNQRLKHCRNYCLNHCPTGHYNGVDHVGRLPVLQNYRRGNTIEQGLFRRRRVCLPRYQRRRPSTYLNGPEKTSRRHHPCRSRRSGPAGNAIAQGKQNCRGSRLNRERFPLRHQYRQRRRADCIPRPSAYPRWPQDAMAAGLARCCYYAPFFKLAIPALLAATTPRSVINPVTRRAGVTSKP